MKILRSYVLKEHLGPFLVALSGLTGVLLAGNIFKLADLVIAKGVGLFDILRLLIYLIPSLLVFTIPLSCLIAIIMAFGRLCSDYELVAMRASGVAPVRLILPLLTMGLLISGGVLLLNDRVAPESHLAFRRQLKAIGIKHPTAYIEAGTFIKEFSPYIIFVYHLERKMLYNVRIYEPQADGPTRTILADRGKFETLPDHRGVRLTLYDGTVDEWDPANPGSLYKVSFTTYAMNLLADTEAMRRLGKKLKEMTFRELVRERRHMEADGIDPRPIILELHRKIASSFATFIFVMLGLAIGLRLHHHERLMTFVWILGWSILYYLATVGTNVVAMKGWLPVWLAMWGPNLVGGLFTSTLLYRAIRR